MENEAAVARRGNVLCKGYNLIFCKKSSLFILVLFPPGKGPLKLRRPSLLMGQRKKPGKTENALYSASLSCCGLESGWVFFSAETFWKEGIFLSNWVLRNFNAYTRPQQAWGVTGGWQNWGVTLVELSWLPSESLRCQKYRSCRVKSSAFAQTSQIRMRQLLVLWLHVGQVQGSTSFLPLDHVLMQRKEFRRASSKAVWTGQAGASEAAKNGACNCSSVYHIAGERKTLQHLPSTLKMLGGKTKFWFNPLA